MLVIIQKKESKKVLKALLSVCDTGHDRHILSTLGGNENLIKMARDNLLVLHTCLAVGHFLDQLVVTIAALVN